MLSVELQREVDEKLTQTNGYHHGAITLFTMDVVLTALSYAWSYP